MTLIQETGTWAVRCTAGGGRREGPENVRPPSWRGGQLASGMLRQPGRQGGLDRELESRPGSHPSFVTFLFCDLSPGQIQPVSPSASWEWQYLWPRGVLEGLSEDCVVRT